MAKRKLAANPKRQLDSFLAKYDPAIVAFARQVLVKMRQRLPGGRPDGLRQLQCSDDRLRAERPALTGHILDRAVSPLGDSVLPSGSGAAGPSTASSGRGPE